MSSDYQRFLRAQAQLAKLDPKKIRREAGLALRSARTAAAKAIGEAIIGADLDWRPRADQPAKEPTTRAMMQTARLLHDDLAKCGHAAVDEALDKLVR